MLVVYTGIFGIASFFLEIFKFFLVLWVDVGKNRVLGVKK